MAEFLAATDLDQAQQIRDAWVDERSGGEGSGGEGPGGDGPGGDEPAGDGLAARAVTEWTDRQAVANLLMYPDLIPADLRVPALTKGLRGEDTYLRLAAAVGSSDVEGLSRTDRHDLLQALLDLISDDPGLPAVRAAASLSHLVRLGDAPDLVVLLRHPDPAVRHNLAVALARMLGDASLADLLGDRDEVGVEDAVDATRILQQDGIDIRCPADELRLLPSLPYLPNLQEWQQVEG